MITERLPLVVFNAERDALRAAVDSLRILAAIQDAVSEIETLGGLAGRGQVAAAVFNHLKGGDADAIRDQADVLDRVLA